MPLRVRFTLRKHYDSLLCRIGVNGVEGSLFNPVKKGHKPIQVGGTWDQGKQKRTDRSEAAQEFNKRLRDLVSEFEAIEARQRSAGIKPTAKGITDEFQTGVLAGVPGGTLLTCFEYYAQRLADQQGENRLANGTLEKWDYTLTYLKTYLQFTRANALNVEHLTLAWGVKFHDWLMEQGMSADTATRYVKKVSEAIDYYVLRLEQRPGRAVVNPLLGHQFGRAKTKEVVFLEEGHLQKFWQIDNQGRGGACVWWMGLIFLTGLDYPDAVRYVQNRDKFDKPGPVRPFIEIRRSKPPKSMCKIPVWPELTALLHHVPRGDIPSADEINDYMYGVEIVTGFPHRLTCKVGRKTAGYIFFHIRGYTIQAVSRIMGHSSVAITERHYLKVTPSYVEQEDARLG